MLLYLNKYVFVVRHTHILKTIPLLVTHLSMMSKLHLVSLVLLILLYSSTIDGRPRTRKIVVHGHEWTVPNEPGWEEILHEAEPFRHKFLTKCTSSRECRMAADRLRDIFLKYPVSAKYYDDSLNNDYRASDIDSIFKWG